MQNNILILKNAKNNPNANPKAWRSFSDLANTLTKHDRDFNACNNIIELCLQPETDPILQNSHYSYLSVNDLVKTY